MQDKMDAEITKEMALLGLSPYWLDVAQGNAILNNIKMRSLFLLTGPNGGGKSSILRSICAAALLGICGLMVPAESAVIPHFDSIMLHMKTYDSPADGKSSFQVPNCHIPGLFCKTFYRENSKKCTFFFLPTPKPKTAPNVHRSATWTESSL